MTTSLSRDATCDKRALFTQVTRSLSLFLLSLFRLSLFRLSLFRLSLSHLCLWELPEESEHVCALRPPPPVDRLVVIGRAEDGGARG